MDIPVNVLRCELQKRFSLESFGCDSGDMFGSTPYIYEAGAPFERNAIYILYSNALPKQIPSGRKLLICVGQQIPGPWKKSGHHIILLRTSASLVSVFNQIQEILQTYQKWSDLLYEELNHDKAFRLDRVIQVGISLLQRPFYVMDSSLSIVISSTNSTNEEGMPVFRISKDTYPQGFQITPSMTQAADTERSIRTPYFSRQTWDNCRLYCYNIYAMDHFACCCFFFEEMEKPFDERDLFLANHFFSQFRRAYLKYIKNFNSKPSAGCSALHHLLTHQPLSNEEYEALSLGSKESWRLFQLCGEALAKVLPMDMMYAMLNLASPGNIFCTIYNNIPVGLIRENRTSPESIQPTWDCFHELLQEMGYIACLSSDFSEWHRLDVFYQQTNFIMEHMPGENVSRRTYKFEDHLLEYILYVLEDNVPAESLYSSDLEQLLQYDQKKNTDLFQTLCIFLENECNISQTARELYLHRTSLMKRLARIEQLLGWPLQNADTRLYLRICIKMIHAQRGKLIFQ